MNEQKSSARNYVEKEALYKEIVEWQDAVAEAKLAGIEPPRMPDSIGKAILDIAEGLGSRWNFRDYSWVDEMIGDGILQATKAVTAFDRNHEAKNAFGFLSFVIWRAFLNRLKKEKAEVKGKMEMMLDETQDAFAVQDGDDFDLSKADLVGTYGFNS